MAELQTVVDEVVRGLERELGERLLGVLLTGSLITGEAGPHSDLDVMVIVAGELRQRRNFVVAGVEVELFLNPERQIERYFDTDRAAGRGSTQYMFVVGRSVFERDGVLTRLRERALREWREGPPPLAANELWRLRYAPADLLRDIDDVVHGDPATAQLLLGQLALDVLDAHYRLARRFRPKRKRLLAELATWDARAAQLAQSALAASAAVERLRDTRALVAHVLAPFEGAMPLTWQTEWVALSDAEHKVDVQDDA